MQDLKVAVVARGAREVEARKTDKGAAAESSRAAEARKPEGPSVSLATPKVNP